jgi:alpha-aminoadipate carrier protein LysW
MITCPECDAILDIEEDELDEGEKLICEECGTHLVVTQVDPLEIDVDEEEDDFEDEDEEEFEDEDEDEEDLDEEEEEEEDWR